MATRPGTSGADAAGDLQRHRRRDASPALDLLGQLLERGEGDVLGDAQSGARTSLRLLRVVADADLIALARAAAEQVLDEDPALLRHPGLAAAIERRVGQQERAALAKN